MKKDAGLIGNEIIEESLQMLTNEPSDEVLAAVLTQIRKRMHEKGQFVVAVDMAAEGGVKLEAKTIKGKGDWFLAFTSFEEQMLGNTGVMSTFMADISQIFDIVFQSDGIQGVVLNAYHNPILLNRQILGIICQK